MLALERQATVHPGGEVTVKAHPFGGGVHILNPEPLKKILGELEFDSLHSQAEADFRLLIRPVHWQALKEFCLAHLARVDDPYLESLPDRELAEEFSEAAQVDLKPDQYTSKPAGFVIENQPAPTLNIHALGRSTLHLYLLFEIKILDARIIQKILEAGRGYTDADLRSRAMDDCLDHGTGRVNSVLTLPADVITQAYLRLPQDSRFQRIKVEDHWLDESTLAILPEVEVGQYQRLP